MSKGHEYAVLPAFDRSWEGTNGASRIGTGEIGGKAQGLLVLRDLISTLDQSDFDPIEITVPSFTVIATDVFDAFLDRNGLHDLVRSHASDDRIANAFQRATLPSEILGDLRALTEKVKWPLAIRSSSRLEDALLRPFAGVYETKMTPNNQADSNTRFQKLVEAIKFVYASTFFRTARDYLRTVPGQRDDEKMAVIIQDIVGNRHQERFYPNLSGVCRSFNFYPLGEVPREDGIVDLALGLGKSIVDDGIAYSYVPSHPKRPPPFSSLNDFLKNSQTEFWAVNMGRPPAFDPIKETEYLVRAKLEDADYDGTLTHVVSTYDSVSERLAPGANLPGPRVVNFAPLLLYDVLPFNDAVSKLMSECRERIGQDVEIEFAMTSPTNPKSGNPRLGFVQVRPMVTSDEVVDIDAAELRAPNTLASSDHVMGNGTDDTIRDIVYTRPDRFDLSKTQAIATELTQLNSDLLAAKRPYLLIGFGRWGTSDPWLGIPTKWGQVSGARAIVEATLADRIIEPSQGTHFFHNITSFGVSYFHVSASNEQSIQWSWLESREASRETEYLRHIHLAQPLRIRVDGRAGLGGIWYPSES